MKINGPGQPPAPGVADADAAKTVSDSHAGERVGETGRAFAEKLAGPAAAGAAGTAAPSGGIAVADLAGALRAGHITSRAAVDELVNRIVSQQLGPQAPAGVREQVRAALEEALENDPLLAAKLRQIS